MKKKQPLVSIILNCYNGEKFLREALESIQNQTYKNWELIFWDNLSNDKSKKIFDSFKNVKFKYFKSKKHVSLYKARNLAIKKTKGNFIAFIDSDDIWMKNKLNLQMKLFSKNNNVALVYGNSLLKKESENKTKIFVTKKFKQGYIFDSLVKNYNIGILTVIINKALIKKKELSFNDKYNIIGDYDLFIRLSKKYIFKALQKPIAIYRIHENNLSLLRKKLQIAELRYWIKTNQKLLNFREKNYIYNKIIYLQFLQKKFDKDFFNTFLFFFRNKKFLLKPKSLIILFTPLIVLRKLMWFL